MQPLNRRLALTLFLAPALAVVVAGAASAQPVADAGADQIFDCVPATGVEVQLDGSASTGDSLGYSWSDGSQILEGVMPVVTLLPGTHVFTLTVTDAAQESATDDVTITLNADLAPQIVLRDGSTQIWPPNHKTHSFVAAGLVEEVVDDCSELGPDDVFFTRATSDERDDDVGDGSTQADVRFADGCGEAFVRAERTGRENGRVYELFLQVADDAGNLSEEARYRVRVAHDRSDRADKDRIRAEYACSASCPEAPSACAEPTSARVSLRDGSKGPSLYWRADGYAEGSLGDPASRLCLYLDDALAGGSANPDKLRVKGDKLRVQTRGGDLEIPALPLAEGAALRLELHDAAHACVGSSFHDPSVNEADRYRAESE